MKENQRPGRHRSKVPVAPPAPAQAEVGRTGRESSSRCWKVRRNAEQAISHGAGSAGCCINAGKCQKGSKSRAQAARKRAQYLRRRCRRHRAAFIVY